MEKSCLFLFDFDETLSVRSSCYPIEELACDRDKLRLDEIDIRYEKEHRCWNRRMNEVHERLAEQGVHTPQLIETFRKLELSPGTEELFRAINDNHHKIVVVSDACDLGIEECLRAHHLLQYVEKIESNPVRQLDPVMFIEEYTDPSLQQCRLCAPNLCKGSVLDQYRDRNLYERLIFVGDSDNDVCPALHLNQADYAFAKIDPTSKIVYKMYEHLKTRYVDQLKAQLFTWTTMNDIHMSLILTRRVKSILPSNNVRPFWSWLNFVWNKYDPKRVQEIGPDRACAEWLLRCGGSVRFKNWKSITADYNAIPVGNPGQYKVEEIRAIKACITSDGLAHLNGLTDLRKIHLEKCDQIGDGSLARLKQVQNSLEELALIDLVQITENGLGNLTDLKNLKQIDLGRLPGVKNRQGIIKVLNNELPQCTVNYDDNHPPAPELAEK